MPATHNSATYTVRLLLPLLMCFQGHSPRLKHNIKKLLLNVIISTCHDRMHSEHLNHLMKGLCCTSCFTLVATQVPGTSVVWQVTFLVLSGNHILVHDFFFYVSAYQKLKQLVPLVDPYIQSKEEKSLKSLCNIIVPLVANTYSSILFCLYYCQ